MIEHLFQKRYHANDYNCAHFVCDAWKDLTGKEIAQTLKSFLLPEAERTAELNTRDFTKLDKPISPCIMLMDQNGQNKHAAMFYNGKALHLNESGAYYLPLDIVKRGFTRVRFYAC